MFAFVALNETSLAHFVAAHYHTLCDMFVEILASIHKLLTDGLLAPVVLLHPVFLLLGYVQVSQLDESQHLFLRGEIDFQRRYHYFVRVML